MPVGQRLWKNKMWAGLSDGQGAEPGSRQGDEGLGPQAWQVWVEAHLGPQAWLKVREVDRLDGY